MNDDKKTPATVDHAPLGRSETRFVIVGCICGWKFEPRFGGKDADNAYTEHAAKHQPEQAQPDHGGVTTAGSDKNGYTVSCKCGWWSTGYPSLGAAHDAGLEHVLTI